MTIKNIILKLTNKITLF